MVYVFTILIVITLLLLAGALFFTVLSRVARLETILEEQVNGQLPGSIADTANTANQRVVTLRDDLLSFEGRLKALEKRLQI